MLLELLNTDLSFATYIIVLLGGLGSGLSPCTFPTVMLIIGYVGGKKQTSRMHSFYLSLAFVLGIAFTLSALGVAASMLGRIFLGSNVIWYIVAFTAIIMGLYLLGYFNFNFNFNYSPASLKRLGKNKGVFGAFLLGLPFGLAASPCTTPVTATVLAYSAAKGSPVVGFFLLFVFALGRSIPLLLAGTFTGFIKNLAFMQRWGDMIQKISGLVLIGLGLYFLWAISV